MTSRHENAYHRFTDHLTARRISLMIIVTLWLLVMGYVNVAITDVVSRDQWAFLPLVKHALEGTLTFSEFWKSHSEHVKPGYKLLFLLNAKYFGLNTKLEIYFGLTMLLGVALIIRGAYFRSVGKFREMRRSLPAFAVIALLIFSFNQVASFRFSLLALGGYAGTLLSISVWALADKARLDNQSPRWKLILLALLLIVDVLGFSGARAPAIIAAPTIALIFAIVVNRQQNRVRDLQAFLALAISGTIGLACYFALLRAPNGTSGIREAIDIAYQNPVKLLNYFALSAANSILNVDLLNHSKNIPLNVLVYTGYVVIAIYLLAIAYYIKRALWKTTLLPVIFILYSAAITGETFLGRYAEFGLNNAASPRYVFDLIPGAIGLAWIMGLGMVNCRKSVRRIEFSQLSIAGLCFIFIAQIYNFYLIYNITQYQIRSGERAAELVRSGNFTTPNWVCPHPDLCKEGRNTLIKHDLNVFRYQDN